MHPEDILVDTTHRARIQYEVAQQPRLLEHLPTPVLDLLQVALGSHRYALRIENDNADLLLYVACIGVINIVRS